MPQTISVRDGKVMVNYVQEGTVHSTHQAALNAAEIMKKNRYPAAVIQDLGETVKPVPVAPVAPIAKPEPKSEPKSEPKKAAKKIKKVKAPKKIKKVAKKGKGKKANKRGKGTKVVPAVVIPVSVPEAAPEAAPIAPEVAPALEVPATAADAVTDADIKKTFAQIANGNA